MMDSHSNFQQVVSLHQVCFVIDAHQSVYLLPPKLDADFLLISSEQATLLDRNNKSPSCSVDIILDQIMEGNETFKITVTYQPPSAYLNRTKNYSDSALVIIQNTGNAFGASHHYYKIMDLDAVFIVPPSSPVFTATFYTSTTSTILWTHPATVPPFDFVLHYNISWSYVGPCSGSGAPVDETRLLHGSRRNFTLTNLRPNSQYLVTLVAVGALGSQILLNTTASGNFLSLREDPERVANCASCLRSKKIFTPQASH